MCTKVSVSCCSSTCFFVVFVMIPMCSVDLHPVWCAYNLDVSSRQRLHRAPWVWMSAVVKDKSLCFGGASTWSEKKPRTDSDWSAAGI